MTMTVKIKGMTCEHCERRVKNAVESLPQVDHAVVSHKDGTAVLYLSSEVDKTELRKRIEAEGYKVKGKL